MDNITFVAPISEIYYIKYMAFYSIFSEASLRPERIIAASGGCMVSYMAMMSDFTNRIELWQLNSSMFVYKPIYVIPRMVRFGLFGSLYKRPDIGEYMRRVFTSSKLKDVEIITGYFSKTRKSIILSSNFSAGSSYLNQANFQLQDVISEYNDGDFDKILSSIISTTNIPIMLPAFGEDQTIDYGVHSPSPLCFLRSMPGRVVYFSPINLEKPSSGDLRELFFANRIQCEILSLSSVYQGFKMYETIGEVVAQMGLLPAFLLVIYTTYEVALNIADFVPSQVSASVVLAKQQVKYRLYG